MTADERRAAGAIAAHLARAARSVVRAVQASEDGDDRVLAHLLNAELDVAGVGHRLAELRREVVVGVMVAAPGVAPAHARDAAGRFAKVANPGAP